MSSLARELVRAAPEVSSPPTVYQRLMAVINHPRSGLADIAGVIAEDQGLTARLLRVVNSAFFSFPQRIDSINQAVTVVGTSQIRDLALATSVKALFEHVPEDLVDVDSFWFHSLACGVTARVVANQRRESNVERFLVAGLLHDIGRLLIYLQMGDEARRALHRARDERIPLFEAERDVLGCDHAEVGFVLLQEWNFPLALQEAVKHHHRPERASRYPVEVATVHLADIVAHALRWGRSGESRVPPLETASWTHLGLEPWQIPVVLDDAERQLEASAHFLDA